MSQFHLKMVEKMKSILHNDDKIKYCYYGLTKFVQAESEKELNFFQEIINKIINLKGSPNLKDKLEDSKNRIIETEGFFKGFEGLYVVEASKIYEIVKRIEDSILNQFNNLDDVTAEAIMAARSFSMFVDKSLEAKLIANIEERFKEIYLDTERQIKS